MSYVQRQKLVGGVVMAASLALVPLASADVYWNNSGAGNWTDGTKWSITSTPFTSGTSPNATEVAWVDQGNVTIDSTVTRSGNIRMGFGSLSGPTPGNGTTGTITIANPALFTHTGNLFIGEFAGKNGTVVQTGGTFDKTNGDLLVGKAGTGTYLLQGGTVNVTKGIVVASNSSFIQSGGTLNFGVAGGYLAPTNGLYEISGGTLNVGSSTASASIDIGAASGIFRVKGSAATLIARNIGGSNVATNKFEFRLDNSAGHISTIVGYSNFGRRGNLAVSLDGGVLLSGASQFDVIKVDAFNGNDFFSRPSAATGLWSAGTVNDVDGTKDVERIALANNRGSIDITGTGTLGVAASNYGYVDLANVNLTEPIVVSLDVNGGTLSNLTTALTNAGITWASGSGIYDVALTLNPAVSGGTKFAWDFSSIDSAMNVQSLSVAAVPEPTSLGLLLIPVAAMVMRRRQR